MKTTISTEQEESEIEPKEEIYTTAFQYERFIHKLNELEGLVKGAASRMRETVKFGNEGGENTNQSTESNLHSDSGVAISLKKEITEAVILYEDSVSTNSVTIGTRVKVKNLNSQDTNYFNIVGVSPSNFDMNEVSYLSPIGQGLIGLKPGESRTIKVPAGKMKFEILEITKYFPTE